MFRFFVFFLLIHSFVFSEIIQTPKNCIIRTQPFSELTKLDISSSMGSYYFPTDMTFRFFADHRLDLASDSIDPDLVKVGDSIYLADSFIPWFVSEIHPRIQHPYILISSDSDECHPMKEILPILSDSKMAYWFCKNMSLSNHPKIRQIPIGQSVIIWGDFKNKNDLIHLSQKTNIERKHLLYMNMQLRSHPSRRLVAQLFQDQPYCFSTIKNLTQKSVPMLQYYQDLHESSFVLAPPGFGPDICRFWEAITLGCIPIVKHSDLDDLYSCLPALIVDEWEDISEAFLRDKLLEIQSKKQSVETSYFAYWADQIRHVQQKICEGTNMFSFNESTKFDPKSLFSLLTLLKEHVAFGESLLCRGSAMGLRPYQISRYVHTLSRIYTQDEWDYIDWNDLRHFKLKPDQRFYNIPRFGSGKVHVFLDLLYRRSRLSTNLEECLLSCEKGTLICGNEAQHPYVLKILTKLSAKYNATVQFESNIWFIIK